MRLRFTKTAEKAWRKFDPQTQNEIAKKVEEMRLSPDLFLQNLKPIFALAPATHRLRVGQFRLLLECDFQTHEHLVLKIGHRREVYD